MDEKTNAATGRIIKELAVSTVVDCLDALINASIDLGLDHVPLTSVVAMKKRVQGWLDDAPVAEVSNG